MFKRIAPFQNNAGQSHSSSRGAFVKVTAYPGGGAVSVYSDDGVTLIPNSKVPVDESGRYAYYAASGRYIEQLFYSEGVPFFTLNDVLVGGASGGAKVENYAALDAMIGLAEGDVVKVIGALSTAVDLVPDGGGGDWVYRATSTATHNGGTVRTATGMGVGRFHRITENGELNVKWFGAKGDGIADDTAEIAAAVAAALDGSTIYFPSGDYLVSSTIDLSGATLSRGLHLRGDGNSDKVSPPPGQTGRSRIVGDIAAAPIIAAGGTAGSNPGGSIRKLNIHNVNATGIGVRFEKFVGGVIEHCSVTAFRGIVCRDSNFSIGIHDCVIRAVGNPLAVASIGIVASGHCTLTNIDVQGFNIGLNLYGSGISLHGLRAEVNVVAIVTGYDSIGAVQTTLTRSHLGAMSFEANDYDLFTSGMRACTISGMETQGSTNSPSGSSDYGIYVDGVLLYVTFESVWIGGTYTTAGFRTGGQNVEGCTLIDCQLNTVSFHANAPSTKFRFIQTNYGNAAPVDTPAQITSDQTNYGTTAAHLFSDTWRLSSDAARTIHGINIDSDTARRVRIINVGGFNITLSNQNATEGTASRRILTGTGADVVLAPDDVADLEYDRTTARWRIVNVH